MNFVRRQFFVSNSIIRRSFFNENRSASSGKTTEQLLKEGDRTTERRLTRGEVFSKANLAPQMYDTNMEDNFHRSTVNSVKDEMRESRRNCIAFYSEAGFTLHDETMLIGPIALFPKTVLSWRVPTPDDITPESMILFTLLEPKLDLVVVGVGDKKYIRAVRERIAPLFRKHCIALEVLDTPEACSTFNYMNNEGRYVAAALYPCLEIENPNVTARDRLTSENYDKTSYGWFGYSDSKSTSPVDDFTQQVTKESERLLEKHGGFLRRKKSDDDDSDKGSR